MLSISNDLRIAVDRLSRFWQGQSIFSPSLELPYVEKMALARGLALPPDFVYLYCSANGTPELYPNHMDVNYCSFLPVEALCINHRKIRVTTEGRATSEQAGVIVFVDFMHRSWEYGFIPNADGVGYRIGIVVNPNEFKVITTSLAEFLSLYVADSDILYDT